MSCSAVGHEFNASESVYTVSTVSLNRNTYNRGYILTRSSEEPLTPPVAMAYFPPTQ